MRLGSGRHNRQEGTREGGPGETRQSQVGSAAPVLGSEVSGKLRCTFPPPAQPSPVLSGR